VKNFGKMLVVALGVAAVSAYGSELDISTTFDVAKEAETALSSADFAPEYNIAYISQAGENNIARIDQVDGAGFNFAAIVQTSAVGSVAYIVQTGSSNRAYISQLAAE
jgi:hypothetical protein